jgi:uncharacterized membrane protein
MKYKMLLWVFAIVGSVVCWIIIDFFIVDLSFWKYLLIETLIILTKMLYEKEKTRITE